MELEVVALALSGNPAPPARAGEHKDRATIAEDLVEKHVAGVRDVVGGVSWLAISVLIGVALGLFLPKTFDAPWILVWATLFGWMACVGAIKIGNGVSNLLETKSRRRLAGPLAQDEAADSAPRRLSTPGEPVPINNAGAGFRTPSPLSVTEETTRRLDDMAEK
jgi:F0F1-type ATP synthase assembly protein I